jgi:hypothetical protein
MCAIAACVIAVAVLPSLVLADEPPPPSEPPPRVGEQKEARQDKSGYTLFNPVPRQDLRELQTDRPDLTEGPYTVDAGHVQVESDLFNYTYDRQMTGPQRLTSQSATALDFNARIGLLNFLEADIIAAPFNWQRSEDRDSGKAVEREGFGDTTLRLKYNIVGNDVDATPSVAFGLLPYIKFPTNSGHLSNHYVEGGCIFPVNLVLPDSWQIGAMTEVDALHNAVGAGYFLQWVNSIVVSRDIIHDRLDGYIEYYTAVSTGRHIGPLESLDVGLLLAITKDVQLDTGINLGITKRAPDYNPFLGLTVRF